MAKVTPIYKKRNRSDKGNYRPVSILPKLSNIFEKCLCKQISTFFEDIEVINVALGKNILLNTGY